MQSWARDTEVLEPLGFQRGFLRTEVEPATGDTVVLDIAERVNLTEWPRVVHLNMSAERACRIVDASAPRWALEEQPAGCVHQHYVAMRQTYTGALAQMLIH